MEIAIAYFEKNLVAARNVIARLSGKPVVETPQLPAIAGRAGQSGASLEERLAKDQDDLTAALAEIDRLTAKGGAGTPGGAPGGASAAKPPAVPARALAVVKPPAPPTPKERIKAAYEKAAAIEDPHKKALAFGEARRLSESLSSK